MNTIALNETLCRDTIVRNYFGGVHASDQLPLQVDKYPKAYVVNVDASDQPGSHWTAFYFASSKRGEFFDSLGQNPEIYTSSFVSFLERNCSQWTYNQRTLQSAFSKVCGQFCIYYLVYRCRKFEMSVITNKFTKNLLNNDYLVAEFVSKHFSAYKPRNAGQIASAKYAKRV